MEWLTTLLISDNFWKAALSISVLVILIAVLANKGLVSFKGKGLKVGNNDSMEIERNIIRSQMQYVKSAVSDFYDDIPYFEGRDEWRLRFICEKIVSVFMDIISLNHISREKIYTEMKQASVWAVIINNTSSDIITSDDFKKVVYTKTAEILDKLVSIREYYKEEKQ